MSRLPLKHYRLPIIIGVLLIVWLLFGRDIITEILDNDPTPVGNIVPGLPEGLDGRLLYSQGRDGIWQIDLASGNVSQWWAGAEDSYVRGIALSPDESQLAIAYEPLVPDSSPESSTDLYLSPVDTPDPIPLLEREDITELYDSPAFALNGEWLYYAHYRPTTDEQANINGFLQTVERIHLSDGTIETMLTDAIEFWRAPDSTQALYVLFSSTTFQTSIWLMDVQDGDPREVVPEGIFLNLSSPRLSADGTTVFFSASGERLDEDSEAGIPRARAHGAPWDVWALTLETAELTRMTTLMMDGPHLAVSPDGTILAILALEGLYLLEQETGTLYEIADSSAEGEVIWRTGN